MKIIAIGPAALREISFRAAVQRCQRQVARLFDPYRPERHYMRGPGPRWREKHGLAERGL